MSRMSRLGRLIRNRPPGGYRGTHLSFDNRRGSVEHYYHFLLGYLVPLMELWPGLAAGDRPILLRSCALMDRHLAALGLEDARILDRDLHADLGRAGWVEGLHGRRLHRLRRHGYDAPPFYDAAAFRVARDGVAARLAAAIDTADREVAALFPEGAPRVLVIDRLPSDPYFLSERSERKGAGAMRRSVPNMAELAEAALRHAGFAQIVTLEDRDLAFQFALFARADVIVAQHGAALANLIWCGPRTRVIEILPDPVRDKPGFVDHFGNLAGCLGLAHVRVGQADEHAAVPVAALEGGLAALPPAPLR